MEGNHQGSSKPAESSAGTNNKQVETQPRALSNLEEDTEEEDNLEGDESDNMEETKSLIIDMMGTSPTENEEPMDGQEATHPIHVLHNKMIIDCNHKAMEETNDTKLQLDNNASTDTPSQINNA